MAITAAVKESFWLRGIVGEFGVEQKNPSSSNRSSSAVLLSASWSNSFSEVYFVLGESEVRRFLLDFGCCNSWRGSA
ncbi:hypothetical protein AAHA92_33201 [Salvia divinorum]|uniref:Uncharacterized protein n=1 Tax=Salvia divinorum TaxID=28513 RepID=A0ABD1FRG8_SALDI